MGNYFICFFILCFLCNLVQLMSKCTENKSTFCYNDNMGYDKSYGGKINLTEQLPQNNIDDNPSAKVVVKKLLQYSLNFDLQNVPGVSKTCRKQMFHYIDDLSKLKTWAVKMFDSTAKLPSGLLNGNVNQLGDFDQCLSIRNEFRGKYCMAGLQFKLRSNTSINVRALHTLLHSHYAFVSDLEDPGHRVPKFSSTNWGICVPSGCSNRDVAVGLKYYLKSLLDGLDIDVDILVDKSVCNVKDDNNTIPMGTLITGALFLVLFCVVGLATLIDYYEFNVGSIETYLQCFSLKHNAQAIMNSMNNKDDIDCVHGIRCINAIMLIISHKSMAMIYVPYVNRTYMSEAVGQPWTVVSRAASLYTDPFIMFSGLLTTYAIMKKLKQGHKISLSQEYISRLIRIIPSFVALILFCTWLMPMMGSGPFWSQVVTHHSDICKRYWWRNLLFIHNYFGFENMCLTHTHHVGIDTQLFMITPPLVLVLYKYPHIVLQTLAALATLSTIARYWVTYTRNLSNFVFFGTSVKQLFETANYMYILPPHRATVYIMGIMLAYLLHYKQNFILSKMQLRIGWALTFTAFIISLLWPSHMGNIDYVYNPSEAANYAAFAPIGWCAFFSYAIFTSHQGHKNWLTKILSYRIYAVWTKISYSVYLTQFPVFFYTIGMLRTAQYYDNFVMQIFVVKEMFLILLSSFLLTLCVEMPFVNIKNTLMKRSKQINKTEKLK